MICHLTGSMITEPVVSKLTGHIYERSNIESYLRQNQVCPVTGEKMSLEDLTEVVHSPLSSSQIRPHASIPQLLKTIHQEWDTFLVDHYHLRKELHQRNIEVTQIKYKLESAYRVISRLTHENAELSSFKYQQEEKGHHNVETKKNQAMEEAEVDKPLLSDFLVDVTKNFSDVSASRRIRPMFKFPVSHAAEFKCTIQYDILANTASEHTQVVDFASSGGNRILTADSSGMIRTLQIQKPDSVSRKVIEIYRFRAHDRPIRRVCPFPNGTCDMFATICVDNEIRLWFPSTFETRIPQFLPVGIGTNGEVESLSLHATRTGTGCVLLLSDSLGTLIAINSETNQQLFRVVAAGANQNMTIHSHPDGAVVALLNSDPWIKLYDLRLLRANSEGGFLQSALVSVLGKREETPFPFTSLFFSQNGYQLVSGRGNGEVALWDLRHNPAKHASSCTFPEEPRSLSLDSSGSLLSVGARQRLDILSVKNFHEWFNLLQGQEGELMGAVFSDANEMFSSSGEHHDDLCLCSLESHRLLRLYERVNEENIEARGSG